MTWPLWAGVGLAVGTVLVAVLWDSDGTILVALVGGVAAFVFLLGGIVIPIQRHYDRRACDQFSEQTARTTRFVVYHTFSWACLVRTADGRWLPREQLREFGEQAP